jgi:hypothetical protein
MDAKLKHRFVFACIFCNCRSGSGHRPSAQTRVNGVNHRGDKVASRIELAGVTGNRRFVLLSRTVTAVECLHYCMKLRASAVITGGDLLPILPQALDAARSCSPDE